MGLFHLGDVYKRQLTEISRYFHLNETIQKNREALKFLRERADPAAPSLNEMCIRDSSVLGQVRIERHEVSRAYLVDLHVTQSRRHTRHQLPVLGGRLGLQLAVCILGKPSLYQVIQFHGRIQRNAAVH